MKKYSFLQYLIESKSSILDDLSTIFGKDIVFNKKSCFTLTDENIIQIFNSLNKTTFNNKLPLIPLYCYSYSKFIQFLKNRNVKILPSKSVLGVHSVLLNTQLNNITYKTKLNLLDDVIMINMSNLENTTFAFSIATVCHEMIHLYDRFYGEYQDMIKLEYLKHIVINGHSTPTFMNKMKFANDNYVKVIDIMQHSDIKLLDFETCKLALSALTEKETEQNWKDFNDTQHISIIDGQRASITME